MKCRVKANSALPHNGDVLAGGTDVDLRPDVAFDVRHLVDEVLPSGDTRAIGTAEREAAELEQALASARPHERISILEAARAAAAGNVAELDRQIAAERRRLDPVAKSAAKAKPAEKSGT